MENRKINKVPPDGGYGWAIVLAMAINSFIYVPMLHCFGLIFKDTFREMGLSAAQISLMINLHAAFGMLTGLLNGILLKTFGYRKVALLAAVFYFFGISMTSSAKSYSYFLLYYGIIASLGFGMSRSSYGLALNTYFKKRRSQAISIAVTITGCGQILIPQLINLLMKVYTPHQVILILGGICGHFFVTATLLQPVKHHMKEEEAETIVEQRSPRKDQCRDSEICDSHLSLEQINKKKNVLLSCATLFDLDLLKDPIFINILTGIALAVFAEMNFNVLTPFFLSEYGLTIDQIAIFLSTAGFTDIFFRMVAPYIGNYLKKSPRQMFVLTLIILIAVRFVVMVTTDFYTLLVLASLLGVGRGIRRVYMVLIIPAHVSLEKLASASGMEMMLNGFCILIGGSILGVVRDITGSYLASIVIINCVTLVTVILWGLEGVVLSYFKQKTKSKAREVEENHPLDKI